MAVNLEQIKELLGSGLSNSVVATAVGCSESYITQLMATEEFAQEVVTRRTANLTSHTKRDNSINGIEDRLIAKLGDLVDEGHIYKPRDVLTAFAIINKAQRRGVPVAATQNLTQTVVTLNLPGSFTKRFRQYETTPDNEVIEAEGQTLVSMNAQTLLSKLSRTEDERKARVYQQTARFLPGTVETTRELLSRRSDAHAKRNPRVDDV